MEIDAKDEEAGTILMALSQHATRLRSNSVNNDSVMCDTDRQRCMYTYRVLSQNATAAAAAAASATTARSSSMSIRNLLGTIHIFVAHVDINQHFW